MIGVVIHYKGSRNRKEMNKIIVEFPEEKKDMIGKKVVYVTPSGKEIVGKITRKHGQKWNKFIVRFDRNVCIEPGTRVEVKE
jgi:ribosomal protein L35AE/L33A